MSLEFKKVFSDLETTADKILIDKKIISYTDGLIDNYVPRVHILNLREAMVAMAKEQMKVPTIQSRIKIGKVIHKGKELETYIPQINLGRGWINIQPKGCYILKESYDPVTICKKCDGNGCNECQNKGFRRGIPVDQKSIANTLLSSKIKEINNVIKFFFSEEV